MISELWNRFPRLLEEHINGLLEGALPNRMKAFHLYKSCKAEGLWKDDFDIFTRLLEEFFSKPRLERTKSAFDVFLRKPMEHKLFEEFYLDFRTADVNQKSVYEVASWAHNILRLQKKGMIAVVSLDVINRTLCSITNPSFFAKARDIEFEDFSLAWKKVVFRLYGQKYDSELNSLIEELDQINATLKLEEKESIERGFCPVIPLTKLEIDWTLQVYQAALTEKPAPKFPLPQGPQKRLLMELERVVILYQIVQVTTLPELIRHRGNIRVTVLDRCDVLLGRKAAA